MGRNNTNQVLPMAPGRYEDSHLRGSALFYTDSWALHLSEVNVAAGSAYTYAVGATDPDGDTLGYSLTQAPAGMTISPTTGVISFTPTPLQLGRQSVSVLVDDG